MGITQDAEDNAIIVTNSIKPDQGGVTTLNDMSTYNK